MKKEQNPIETAMAAEMQESRLTSYIFQYGRNILYALLGLLVLFFIMYYTNSRKKTNAAKDYISAQYNYAQLEQNLEHPNDPIFSQNLDSLKQVMKDHPELHGKYDTLIAQALIFADLPQEAQDFANPVFTRVKDEISPYYVDYAQASLLMIHGEYKQAYEQSAQLKERLAANKEALGKEQNLYALNLLRLAILQQQIGTKQDELAAWDTFQQYAQENPASLKSINTYFASGKVSLNEYIEARKLKLKS